MTKQSSSIFPLFCLIIGAVFCWSVLAYPAWRFWGEAGVLQSAVAMGLCLVPGVVTLAWGLRAGQGPDTRLLVFLGGTGIRMVVVLGGGMLLHRGFPDHFPIAFWLWLLFFYIFTLALEMVLLVRRKDGVS